jgi:hypothetical protein
MLQLNTSEFHYGNDGKQLLWLLAVTGAVYDPTF